jgi:uncharacterized protein (DUF4415 family)
MPASKRNTKRNWVDPDDAPELTDEFFERAEIAVGGKVIRPAKGTLTRPPGRPKSAAPKRSVHLRLSPDVVAWFRAKGPGWQTRIDEALRKAAKLGPRKA